MYLFMFIIVLLYSYPHAYLAQVKIDEIKKRDKDRMELENQQKLEKIKADLRNKHKLEMEKFDENFAKNVNKFLKAKTHQGQQIETKQKHNKQKLESSQNIENEGYVRMMHEN